MYIKEVTASLYPWDLADEGADRCIDNVTGMAGANSLYLIGLMHWEKRPLTDMFYPHNPVRKYYIPENSRIYYHVPEKAFEGLKLKPIPSEREFLKNTDWLDLLSQKARERSLKIGVELSHTIYDTERIVRENPELLQKNIDGNIISGSFLCFNNTEVREYIKTLFYQTAANHDIDFIQTCLLLFANANTSSVWSSHKNELDRVLSVVNGGCFCDACRAKAESQGYDWDSIKAGARELHKLANNPVCEQRVERDLLLSGNMTGAGLLLEYPALFHWLDFRVKSVTSLLKDIYNEVKRANSRVEVRLNSCFELHEFMGLSHRAAAPFVDSVRDSDYSEQKGDISKLSVKKEILTKTRRGLGFDKPLLAGIGIRPKATPEIIKASIKMLSNLGVDGLSLGHYDGASLELLKAVKEGMQEADMNIL